MVKAFRWCLFLVLSIGIIGVLALRVWNPEYAYVPPTHHVLPAGERPHGLRTAAEEDVAWDLWGRSYTKQEAAQLLQTTAGKQLLSPANGAVEVNERMKRIGRDLFYTETFGNEEYITDVLGIVNGPLRITNIAQAVLALKGQGTNNLRVALAEDVTLGSRVYHKGELVDTGLDVAPGGLAPIGMPVKVKQGRLKVGITCAACHAAYDPHSKKVVEGVPNLDLNSGLLLALSTNSSSYFTHVQIKPLAQYVRDPTRTVTTSNGQQVALPDPAVMEQDIDAMLVQWPPGYFDSMYDGVNNPTQIPDTFTRGGHPYGWNGFAMQGPFKGLSSLNNNVHTLNSDALSEMNYATPLYKIDVEVQLATMLQHAANPSYRYDPRSGQKPSAFFNQFDPTPLAPGLNNLLPAPSYPKGTLLSPSALFTESEGLRMNEGNNALSVYQNALNPPPSGGAALYDQALGRRVFTRAGCAGCHAGAYLTNNRIIPVGEIGTEPSRALALKQLNQVLVEPSTIYPPDTPLPVPPGTKTLTVPKAHLERGQIQLAYAQGNSAGGYKVKHLRGLGWSAPYLHDGGVAVGPHAEQELGIPGTLKRQIAPDPRNSLRALLDRDLRRRVIAANAADPALRQVHVQGIGHEKWVDRAAGYTKQEQDALIDYLLHF